MFYKAKLIAIILFCSLFASAQTVPDNTEAEAKEKLRKEAVAFLRETLTDVGGMRSLENRISFSAEIAGLMWFHDEREARSMYGAVMTDFRDLLVRYDAQMNALGVTLEDAESRGFMSFMMEPTDKSRMIRKFATANGVRQQIAMSLAEHDPELAFAFYNDSITAISNPEFRKQAANNDFFETQLLTRIAENNPGKAAQLGARSLATGVSYQHIELLKKIHTKDADKGAEYGATLFSRIKADKIDNSDFYVLSGLMEFGGRTLEESRKPGGKRSVYTLAELREMAEVLAQAILSRPASDASSAYSHLEIIQKYSPGRAAQIRAKFKLTGISGSSNTASNVYRGVPPEYAGEVEGYGAMNSNANMNGSARYEREKREREALERQEKQMIEDVKKLEKRELPKEERQKIIAEARRIIMQTPGRDKKVMSLSMLAAQVARFGDKDLAAEIMKDAEALVNPAPRNYQDFLLSWLLASGYAQSHPDRAFPILEETIGRANETIAAFIKVGEFVDVAEEMIQDGEVQVGAFGGGMVRGLQSELGMADATIQVLAHADFAKTKALTHRFDRPEIRILAKMMVLRAVLNPKHTPKLEDTVDTGPGGPDDK